LNSVFKDRTPNVDLCLLRPPHDDDGAQTRVVPVLQVPYSQATLRGLFVPKMSSSPTNSYVDIARRRASSPSSDLKKGGTSSHGPRKVSNASTATTQADPETIFSGKEDADLGSRESQQPSHDSCSLGSDSSDLTLTTSQRKLRMEARKKDIKAKTHEDGLRAIITCPKEEPERSIPFIVSHI
jgi:hypothetical protein